VKWDRLVACVMMTGGIAYASYSLTTYFQKLEVIKPAEMIGVKGDSFAEASDHAPMDHNQTVIFSNEERPKKGEHFADLYIPRLNAVIPVFEGTEEEELEKGVGHYSGSVLPGEPDNAVLSGHRDTVFRRMGEMKKGDELHVHTIKGTFVYVIDKMWVTDAEDRTVIVPREEPILTLTTCYPFSYIGPAPKRYIIEAKLVRRIR
jgi:sortase A